MANGTWVMVIGHMPSALSHFVSHHGTFDEGVTRKGANT
jgi:hypothetical protein